MRPPAWMCYCIFCFASVCTLHLMNVTIGVQKVFEVNNLFRSSSEAAQVSSNFATWAANVFSTTDLQERSKNTYSASLYKTYLVLLCSFWSNLRNMSSSNSYIIVEISFCKQILLSLFHFSEDLLFGNNALLTILFVWRLALHWLQVPLSHSTVHSYCSMNLFKPIFWECVVKSVHGGFLVWHLQNHVWEYAIGPVCAVNCLQ